MEEEVYRLEGVSYYYSSVIDAPALREVSFCVYEGETVSIVGANGTGKSTLLKILDCLIFPASGTMSFYGEGLYDGFDSVGFRERVGLVFSEPDVQLFCPTVVDEVSFGPMQIGMSAGEVQKRVSDTLEMLGISSLKERPPYTLSSGEKKKVAIASVLSINPDVLLMDEPTTSLDARTQVWLIELMEELRKLKKTCVIATHDLSLAGDLSDRVVVLDESHRVAAEGKSRAIFANKRLLLDTNLIHEHAHRHGEIVHVHSHSPYSTHDEHD